MINYIQDFQTHKGLLLIVNGKKKHRTVLHAYKEGQPTDFKLKERKQSVTWIELYTFE